MSDPPRLLDTASTEADLLEAWSSMRAPQNARAKALALAGLSAGVAATVGASVAAKASAGAGVVGANAAGAGLGVAAGTGVAAGAGSAVASATATGAGVVAAKWIAAIGIVAVLGGGSVVAAKKMSAPTTTATVTATDPAARTPERRAHEARRDAELRGTPTASSESSLGANANPSANLADNSPPVVAAADLPNAESVHSATTAGAKGADVERRRGSRSSRPTNGGGAGADTERSKSARPTNGAAGAAEPAAPEPAPVASTLGAEVSSLDSARNALRTGDPARSLRELDAFDAKHPGSALAEDAALLRFDANVALGDRAGADKAARTFLARYPSSPRATKVRRYLDGAN